MASALTTAGIGLMFLLYALVALTRGRIGGEHGVYDREQQPATYWVLTLVCLATGLAGLAGGWALYP